jgi:hypothetical protein
MAALEAQRATGLIAPVIFRRRRCSQLCDSARARSPGRCRKETGLTYLPVADAYAAGHRRSVRRTYQTKNQCCGPCMRDFYRPARRGCCPNRQRHSKRDSEPKRQSAVTKIARCGVLFQSNRKCNALRAVSDSAISCNDSKPLSSDASGRHSTARAGRCGITRSCCTCRS